MTQPRLPACGPDLYAILGISSDAHGDQVTRAFRARLRALHPDTADDIGTGTQAAEELEAVLAAWRILHDPVRRAAYDRARTPARPKPPAPPPPPAAGGPAGTGSLVVGLTGASGSGVVMWIAPPVWIEHGQSRADP